MRILHVIGSLAPRYGGPSTVAPAMCRALAARGHHVELATTDMDGSGAGRDPADRATTLAGVPVTYRRVHWPRSYAASLGLGRWLRRHVERFDVVHIHSLYQFHTWYAARCCRRADVPYVVRPHGALDPYHLGQRRWRKALCTWLVEGRALDAAAGMHYTSIAEHQHAVGHRGRLPRGFVVPLGVELAPPGQWDELLRRHPELAGRTLVTFLGRLTPKKRLDLLVDAFAAVAGADQRAHLVVAGPDDGVGPALRARIAALGLQARVSMLGLLTGPPKSALLRQSRVVALPSEDESFGVAVAEAMHAGTAVVVTDGVAIHREVAAARAGLVVAPLAEPLAEALLGFVRDEQTAAEAGRNGQALARSRWTWRQVAADLERMYQAAIDSRSVAWPDATPLTGATVRNPTRG
jgi:glycosyltransferase involved in cell wall biosynthesis